MTVVLVHGGWSGPQDWDEITAMLSARGVESGAVDLPSCREGVYGDAHDDATAIREAIDGCQGPTVVCGYSYGGFPMTAAVTDHPQVRRLLYLAAFMPDEGDTVLDLMGRASEARTDEAPVPHIFDDGTSLPDLSRFEALLAHHPREVIDRIVNMPRRRQAVASAVQTPASLGWRTIPSTYVLTLRDGNIPPSLQRSMAARASEVIEIDYDHFVPFSNPDVVVGILVRAALAEPVVS